MTASYNSSTFRRIPCLAERCRLVLNRLKQIQNWGRISREWPAKALKRLKQETGTGLNGNSKHLVRLVRGISLALPVASAMFLVSCTSTGSSLDVSGASLQAASPQPSLNSQIPAPIQPSLEQSQGSAPLIVQTQIGGAAVPTPPALDASADLAKGQESVAGQVLVAPAEANTLAAPAPIIALNQPVPSETGVIAPPTQGTNEALIAKAASAAQAAPQSVPVALTATDSNVDPARFGTQGTEVATASKSDGQILTAAPAVLESAPPVKKKGLFANLFASQPKKAVAPKVDANEGQQIQLALADPTPTKPAVKAASIAPVLQPANLQLAKLDTGTETLSDVPESNNGDLPGVRKGALFEIKRRDSLDSDADIDIGETDGGPVLLASAAGLARLAPNGLKVQRESVDVACLKPQLVKMLKGIERHYGRTVVVTSGYRSPGYNRRVRGAKNSLHMFCAAADIQVSGVGKWELAKYVRSMSGRGGVGTYCHTNSVHVDVGPDRDWNWRCSRRK